MSRRHENTLWVRFFVLLLCACLGCAPAEPERGQAQRIISLAPSTTEILFALELGDCVVGVTRYCDYPASADKIAKVGGYVDPNYEEIVALKPDLTILLTSHRDAKAELQKLGLRTLSTPHETIGDIHEAIRLIGEACNRKKQADTLLDRLTRRTQTVQKAVQGEQRPRVLICIGRDTRSGRLSGMYMAGRHGFYDEIIQMAGGVNAYDNEPVAYPQVSAEGVLQMNPDVIVDLVSPMIDPGEKAREDIEKQWRQLRMVAAVRTGRVHAVVGIHALRPGPRYAEFLEQLARLLHPDAFPKDDTDE
jgi:iron complex transport system substrate-binding protein